jgi:photosystem II stability/assembly factor-like uncharacterized protein
MTPPNDVETRLRAALAEHARHAPPGGPVADRILAELDAPVLRPRHGWRTWTFPLLAAAAIAAVALTLVGVSNIHFSATGPAATRALSQTPTSPQPTHPTSPQPTQPSRSAPPTSFTTKIATANTDGVTGFRATDMSFVSQSEGWALGSANCLHGAGRCTEVMHTSDGQNWTQTTGEAFNVPGVKNCASPCVSHVRFANSSVGYAYGPDALFMTTDGGGSWAAQNGLGADVLETLDNNVILVRAESTATPLFRRAKVGSSRWSSFTVPGFPSLAKGDTVQLARAAGVTLLAVSGYHPASGFGQYGALYRSTDAGTTWKRMVRPCGPVPGGYHVTIAAATVAAGDGSMAVDCATQWPKDVTGGGEVYSATPGSTKFVAPGTGGKVLPAPLIGSPTHDVQFVVTPDGQTYRSNDAGDTWSTVQQLSAITFIGFESDTNGRAVGEGGRVVWTTHDSGATWSEAVFPA